MRFEKRNTRPLRDNENYYTIKNKYYGKSENLVGQCTWYAFGRVLELVGECKIQNANARNWYNQNVGYNKGKEPKLGAILCFDGNYGHVTIVEEIFEDYIVTSEFNYGGDKSFHIKKRYKKDNYALSGSPLKFQGFIYLNEKFEEEKEESTTLINPAIGDVHYTEPVAVDPFPNISDEELAKRVWNGDFGNGDSRKNALGIRYNAVQALVNKGFGKPEAPKPIPTPQPKPEPTPSVDILTLVKKTIRGDFGNGEARKKALGSNYAEVQRQVNLNIQNGLTRWDNIKLF